MHWNRASPVNLSPKRLIVNLKSEDILKINVTRTLIDLYKNVKEVWTQDYYNPKEKYIFMLFTYSFQFVVLMHPITSTLVK